MFVFFNDFLSSPANAPFSIALMIVVMIAMLEGLGMVLGFGVSAFVDNLFPKLDINVDGPELESSSSLGKVISWIRVRGVPALVLLIIFLSTFGVFGLLIQSFWVSLVGSPLQPWIVSIPAIAIAFPAVKVLGEIIAYYMPKDETSAVGLDSLVGKIARITIGEARVESPAQGKVKDEFGKDHYVMISPVDEGEAFSQNDEVVLIKRDKSVFYAVRNTNESMIKKD